MEIGGAIERRLAHNNQVFQGAQRRWGLALFSVLLAVHLFFHPLVQFGQAVADWFFGAPAEYPLGL